MISVRLPRDLQIVLHIIVGGVFALAGIIKAFDFQTFADAFYSYDIIPLGLVNVVALGLPPLEILIGLALLTGIRTRASALAAFSLMILFLLVLTQAVSRGLPLNCGCFGSLGNIFHFPLWVDLGRDVVLTVAALLLYMNECRKEMR